MNTPNRQKIGRCGKPVDQLGKSGDSPYSLYRHSVSALLLFALFTPSVLTAEEERGVMVSEIMWAGAEYIELYNDSSSVFDVSKWKIKRQGEGDCVSGETVVQISSGKQIGPGSYFLIQKQGATTVGADEERSSLSLNDSGELLRLCDASESLVDIVNRAGSWIAGSKDDGGVSMERIGPNGQSDEDWVSSGGAVGGRHGTPKEAAVVISPTPIATPSPSSTPSPTPLPSASVSPSPYPATIVINEFLPDPAGDDSEGEFIELKNTGESVVDLGDWQLDDEEGGSSPYVIPSGVLISAGGIKLFPRPETKISLNNDGDQVRIFSPDGIIQVTASYSVARSGYSYAYVTESSSYQETTTPTPGAENIITLPPTPTPRAVSSSDTDDDPEEDVTQLSTTIVINEFLPNPSGSDTVGEFIELYNFGNSEVLLTNWQIDDVVDGGSKPYTIPRGTVIGAGKFLVFERSETKIAINNSNETIRLIDPNGVVQSSFSFTEALPEDISVARVQDGSYVATSTITKGKSNIITAVDTITLGEVAGVSSTVLNIEQIRSMKMGSSVLLEGVVSAPNGLLGKTVAYLAGSGIQLYFSKAQWPSLAVGDRILVRGILSSVAGESKINIASAQDIVVVSSEEPPEPHVIETGKIGEEFEGFLVDVHGMVTQSSGTTFYIDDGSGEVRVVIKESTGITKPRTTKGTAVRIVGIVSQTETGYRILPRFQTDVTFGKTSTSSTKGKTSAANQKGPVVAGIEEVGSPLNVFEGERVSRSIWRPRNGVGMMDAKKNIFVVFGVGAALTQVVGGVSAGEPLLRRRRPDTKEQWQ